MKYPHEINSDFFDLLLSAGWTKEREIILKELPRHLEEMPNNVKTFLRELWYISFAKKFFSLNQNDDYLLHTDIYIFGETTTKLEDYSIQNEYTEIYNKMVDCKIRNFGFKHFRELLIDEWGRIYIIPDSGDLYVFEGRFYEALYNVIYRPNASYLIGDNFQLYLDSNGVIKQTSLLLQNI